MKESFFEIENENKIFRVKKNEIISIKVNSGISTFYLEDGRKLNKTITLKKVLELLPNFVKIYKNEAINNNRIKEICKVNRRIRLDNNEVFSVSYRYISKIRLSNN